MPVSRSTTSPSKHWILAPALPARLGWCHPQPVRRFAERMLGQQLWCWGRDIKFEGGNLLMQYGFRRHRAGAGKAGSTCYRFDSDSRHICLWGFGIFFGLRESGGLYVSRFDYRPLWANLESLALGIHRAADLPPFSRPRNRGEWRRAHRVFRAMLAWIASYEGWVIREAGQVYRRQCVRDWLYPVVRGDRMPAAWRALRGRGWDRRPDKWRTTLRRLCSDPTAIDPVTKRANA